MGTDGDDGENASGKKKKKKKKKKGCKLIMKCYVVSNHHICQHGAFMKWLIF